MSAGSRRTTESTGTSALAPAPSCASPPASTSAPAYSRAPTVRPRAVPKDRSSTSAGSRFASDAEHDSVRTELLAKAPRVGGVEGTSLLGFLDLVPGAGLEPARGVPPNGF